MGNRAFTPTVARTQNSVKIFSSTKTNATIRDLEEEEGELEEKEGTVVSIDRDKINGTGWTVKDAEGNTYVCSCASSMYEIPETVERGGILYPTDTVTVTFTVNPVLRINTIKEITSLGEETEKIDISQWTHGDAATTVIAKPKSAVTISDGLVSMNYNNDNQMIVDPDGIKTSGKETQINTETLSINSEDVTLQGTSLSDILNNISEDFYANYDLASLDGVNVIIDSVNSMTQANISGDFDTDITEIVIGELKNQQSFPLRKQEQQLITDNSCTDILVIDENGIISIEFETDSNGKRKCPAGVTVSGNYNWITPQGVYRNYIKVTVQQTCDYCIEGNNTTSEYVNYCPSCQNWNTLIDTSTSIRCTTCDSIYCQNCGTNIKGSGQKLKKYRDNYIIGYGNTCNYCNTQLQTDTSKYYINYCPDCQKWGFLYATQMHQNNKIINVLQCGECNSQFCCSCGTDQTKHGLTLTDSPVQYSSYKNALRKLKYVRDGN